MQTRTCATLLFGNFNDEGRAAGSVLTAGLHGYVVVHPEHLGKSKEIYAEVVKRVNKEGDEFAGFGDDLDGGARIALAQVSTLHLDDIAQAAGGHGYQGPIQKLDRDDLKDFFKAILSEMAPRTSWPRAWACTRDSSSQPARKRPPSYTATPRPTTSTPSTQAS